MTTLASLLCRTEPPWFHTTTADLSSLTNALWAARESARSDLDCRVSLHSLRGACMESYAGLMSEFAAVLQFPYYFGHNLNALLECLDDLDWIEADALTLVITNAERLLKHEGDETAADFLVEVAEIAQHWNQGRAITDQFVRPPTGFHVLLHTTPTAEAAVLDLLRRARLACSPLRVE